MAAITEAELTRAVERTLVAKGKLPPERARAMSQMVLGYFGPEDAVLDNKLSSEDRDDFYKLEEEGLLTSEEEDATVSRGKTWRIHYWLLKKDRIRDASQIGEAAPTAEDGAVYREVGDDMWNRHSEKPAAPPPS
ncbi:MAG TPA: DUF6015 family protein [Thermoplasmata archaeon]|nr:DUF6015 family protein [Thermoplasmata archaeon]